MASHPMWVRGLKLQADRIQVSHHNVAPYVGAWIEIVLNRPMVIIYFRVAPYVGAWIEIGMRILEK